MDFASRQIHATATYQLDVAEDAQRVLLDCRGLDIQAVTVDGQEVEFELGPERPFIGQPLSIPVTSRRTGRCDLQHDRPGRRLLVG